MKTTLNLDARLWARLKAAAATQGRTMSELVELAIRRLLQERRGAAHELPPLPTFDGGGTSVDLANRDELYRVLEGR
jgi:hypothetical protein